MQINGYIFSLIEFKFNYLLKRFINNFELYTLTGLQYNSIIKTLPDYEIIFF